MEWEDKIRGVLRRSSGPVVVTASAALCVAVSGTRGQWAYPWFATLLKGVPPLEGILPAGHLAGFVHWGLMPLAVSTLLLWRKRRPAPLALLLMLSTLGPFLPGALIALFTVASTCPVRTVYATTALGLLPLPLGWAFPPPPGTDRLTTALTAAVLVGAAVGWGLVSRSMRERKAEDQARAAERTDQVRRRERESLAREMHDVLAHRLSLLSVHAGALQVHPGAPPEQIAQSAEVIRSSAHQAMEDLQQVLGVLRTPLQPADARPEPPQPTLADLTALLEESRAAGMDIDMNQNVAAATAPVPPATGRTAYRIVQEALTNARKHAPGQTVRIRLDAAPRAGLTLEVTNPATDGPGAALPGSGSGLAGLRERAALVGGELTYGRTGHTHHIRARLPWPA
ncbi:sensor histidine kinase [Streptomyces sp. NPDC051563]|uniref:sensor histidine kinase n=1 Tax=Streptomyces sp. NPDC051563 TaxID=3365659 RepID=UPI00378BC326